WVAPLEALETTFSLGFKYSTGGHAKGNFLLGQVSQDPGALFYPVTWLYRTSPVVITGVVAMLIALVGHQRIPYRVQAANGELTDNKSLPNHSSHLPWGFAMRPFFRYLPLMLIFILGYYLLMTLGEKKQERYFLPVYPWLNLIAAAGLISILDFGFWIFTHHASRITHHASRITLYILVILFQAALVFSSFPYYFTYYNPLLGGIQGAAQAVTIGWGEGLDLAADYLNQNTNPARTRVASWYESTFAPFYRGDSISYSKEKGKALAGDYVIFYINQTQRRFPDDIFFDYYESRFQPEKVITLQGLDYAWIYPSLGIDHYLEDQTYTGIASLLAWQWANGDAPLIPGQPRNFELYWEYLGKQPDETFFFRLVDGQARLWAEGRSQLIAAENPPRQQWREGEIIVEQGTLTLPAATPPGQYQLQIGFYTQAPAVTEGELLFTLPVTESLITIGHADPSLTYQLPLSATLIEQQLGDSLTLLGASWPTHSPLSTPQSPLSIPLDLYWRVEQAIPADSELHIGLMDQAGVAQQAWFNLSLAETINPAGTTWQPGDLIHTSWRLSLLPQVPAGAYTFDLVLPAPPENGQPKTLSFGNLAIGAEEVSKK
ncbi:MAG TPA: hypothetical protein VEC96_10760, partial [Anaerolineae bacterium]|nr:hypothetical protein [Anaerolineae bacterium]